MEYHLVIISGDPGKKQVTIKPPAIIGRSRQADVTIGQPLVSRKHCEITASEDGTLVVEDLGSLNGTYVGEERITEAVYLESGDLLTVGSVTFRAHYGNRKAHGKKEQQPGFAAIADDEAAEADADASDDVQGELPDFAAFASAAAAQAQEDDDEIPDFGAAGREPVEATVNFTAHEEAHEETREESDTDDDEDDLDAEMPAGEAEEEVVDASQLAESPLAEESAGTEGEEVDADFSAWEAASDEVEKDVDELPDFLSANSGDDKAGEVDAADAVTSDDDDDAESESFDFDAESMAGEDELLDELEEDELEEDEEEEEEIVDAELASDDEDLDSAADFRETIEVDDEPAAAADAEDESDVDDEWEFGAEEEDSEAEEIDSEEGDAEEFADSQVTADVESAEAGSSSGSGFGWLEKNAADEHEKDSEGDEELDDFFKGL